jgi:hypothetical protein
MKAHLEGRGGDQPCEEVVLHQWAKVRSTEARRRRWRREHHTPVPWIGHLSSARMLFVSSNANLARADLRPTEESHIPEPIPLDTLRDATVADHPSLRKPFRAPKWYWANDEITDSYESVFEVWAKDDGVRPLSAGSGRRREVPYWRFAHDQAQHLYPDHPVRAGVDYALTEVVHCKSAEERGVAQALVPCVERYLERVLALSLARVIFVVGARAADAFEAAFGLSRNAATAVIGPIRLAGVDRLLVFLPHPGRARRMTKEAFGALVLPSAVQPAELAQLRAEIAGVGE